MFDNKTYRGGRGEGVEAFSKEVYIGDSWKNIMFTSKGTTQPTRATPAVQGTTRQVNTIILQDNRALKLQSDRKIVGEAGSAFKLIRTNTNGGGSLVGEASQQQ